MAKTKKSHFFEKVFRVIGCLPLFFKAANHAVSLVKEETVQVKKNVTLLLALFLILSVLCTTTWFCLLGMLFFTLLSFKVPLTFTLLIIFFLNVILIAIVGWRIIRLKRDFFFPECQRLLLHFKK